MFGPDETLGDPRGPDWSSYAHTSIRTNRLRNVCIIEQRQTDGDRFRPSHIGQKKLLHFLRL